MDEILDGGRNGIYRKDKYVFRPAEIWTKDVHNYLKYLHSKGFTKVPYPVDINKDGLEQVSFVEGTVYNGLLPDWVKSDQALISFCTLIKQFHEIGEKYVRSLSGNERWMLPTRMPIETMCHGDLAPYNIVMEGDKAIGIIDFDTLHPGPRLWDIAYSLYRWIPLMSANNPENFGSEEDKQRRFDLFIKTYGITGIDNKRIIQVVIKRLEYLIRFMEAEARNGNATFKQHIEDGHLGQYQEDLRYISKYWGQQ